jgi:hypothetical protein
VPVQRQPAVCPIRSGAARSAVTRPRRFDAVIFCQPILDLVANFADRRYRFALFQIGGRAPDDEMP